MASDLFCRAPAGQQLLSALCFGREAQRLTLKGADLTRFQHCFTRSLLGDTVSGSSAVGYVRKSSSVCWRAVAAVRSRGEWIS